MTTTFHTRARRAAAAAAAALALAAPARAQNQPSPFHLAATRDYAVTGMRTAADYRFWVSNAGPMDAQQGMENLIPAQIRKANAFQSFANEITLWAAAGPTDYAANRARLPSLANVRNAATGGHSVMINNHIVTSPSHWLPADGSLGVLFSGARTPAPGSGAPGCLDHSKDLVPPGFTVMAGSDCEPSWGVAGWKGRGYSPFSTYLSLFQRQGDAFTFDFWRVPTDPSRPFIGSNFQTFGVISDFHVNNRALFGNVVPGGSGPPNADGYPLGLDWEFDAFNFKDPRFAGMVFWQALLINRSRERYGVPLDYDSLYAGFVVRPTAAMARAGFAPHLGAVVFNDLRSRPDCDGARPLPERLTITNFNGSCASIDVARGFTRGAMAFLVLKSPIGDLRNKLFTDPNSPFYRPGHPLAGDTITYNIGRSCGLECSAARVMAGRARSAFGVLASREADALAGDLPSALGPLDYWFLFHPANGAAYGDAPRVDLSNPRGGGGFNWCVPGPTGPGGKTWTYKSRRPRGAPVGPDTLWLDDCNPATNALVPMWADTFPDRGLKLIRGAEYIGAGPFRLAADDTAAFVVALVLAPDSVAIENAIREAIALYNGFYTVQQSPPTPRVVAVDVIHGNIQNTAVRITLDASRLRWTDEFLLFEANRYRTAPPNTEAGRLRRFNPWLPDSLERRARDNIRRMLVYKSCNPNATTLTYTTTNVAGAPCAAAEQRDTLNRILGPVAYREILRPDTVTLFTDGAVIAGQSYYYAFVVETRGAEWTVIDSIPGRGLHTRTLTVETKVHELPTLRSAPNVAIVYVPASMPAGGGRADVRFLEEKGGATIDTLRQPGLPDNIFSWANVGFSIMGPIEQETRLRLVFGDRVLLEEYRQAGAVSVDSVKVRVVRSRTAGFTITGSTTATTTARATPILVPGDTLVYRAGPEGVPSRSLGPLSPTVATVGNTTITTSTFTGPVGVLVNETNPQRPVPLFISNVMTGFPFTPYTFPGHPNSIPLRVSLDSTTLSSPTTKGFINRVIFDPRGRRVTGAQVQLLISLGWLFGPTRNTFAGLGGEYVLRMADEEFGTDRTFRLDQGRAAITAALGQALAARAAPTRTATDAATAAVVARFLNRPGITADSLIEVKVPFTITNRAFGNAPVRLAMLRSDKDSTYLLGSGPDTLRVPVPRDVWLPGDRLIAIEEVPTTAGNTPVVSFYPLVIGCGTGPCNPVSGPGGDATYGATPPGTEIRVRYFIPPARPPRELAFALLPTRTGPKITSITQAQLDSVQVVPNPYIVFSTHEQQASGERILFTHLPPQGKIQIFTVAGQFVQELTWTPEDLRGSGDLFFNLRTKEDTEMASGLYLYVVTATDPATGRKLKKVGRFIIVR